MGTMIYIYIYIFLIMGNAGFISSTVGVVRSVYFEPHGSGSGVSQFRYSQALYAKPKRRLHPKSVLVTP